MQLQIALDRIPLDRALAVTAAVAPLADWIEVGTSLVKRYGVAGLAAVVGAAAGTPVLADLKTADDAAYEFALAYDAGAASATVLGLAADATLDTAVRVAEERGREVVVDLMEVPPARRAALAARLPGHVVLAAHVGKDAQASGTRPADLLGPWAEGRRLALAGGLTAADLPALADLPDLRVIVGSAVTKADDPLAAVRELRAAARLEKEHA
jgi:3-hexulose-6-phosphate synthase